MKKNKKRLNSDFDKVRYFLFVLILLYAGVIIFLASEGALK